MELRRFGPMGMRESCVRQLPLHSDKNSVLSSDIFVESEMRDLMLQVRTGPKSAIASDNDDKDLDFRKGRILRRVSCEAPELSGGKVDAVVSIKFDPNTSELLEYAVTSQLGNFETQAIFNQNGETAGLTESRHLKDGSSEYLCLMVAGGVLYYNAELSPPKEALAAAAS